MVELLFPQILVLNSSKNIVNLVDPNIINGCQTISIASKYLENLESSDIKEQIDNFKQIKVMAKIVYRGQR